MLIPIHDDNPTHRFPYVTVAIIVLNCLAAVPFGFYLAEPTHQMRVDWATYGFVPQQLTNLPDEQPVEVDLYRELGEAETPTQDTQRIITIRPSLVDIGMTLVTCMFLHGGWWHLLGNMLFLWIFGNNIEDRIGHALFALFYLLGGVVATLCHWWMAAAPLDTMPMIGASGAVAVMMGAYMVTYPKAKVRVLFLLGCFPLFFSVPAVLLLVLWIGEQVLGVFFEQQGFTTDVALWAHIGGFVVGAAMMPLLAAVTIDPRRDAPDRLKPEELLTDPYDRKPPTLEDNRGIWWRENGK